MGVKVPEGLILEIEEPDDTELHGIDWLVVICHPSLPSALCKCCGG
jgi:hypothetical protein